MRPGFEDQFSLAQKDYLDNHDLITWLRHYRVLRDLLGVGGGDILEIGTGDGILRRCVEPFVTSYRVMDINPNLAPDYLGDIRVPTVDLQTSFDNIVITEVLEHLPFEDMALCLANLWAWLRPGGHVFVSIPHRKGSLSLLTPKQRLHTLRFPNGLLSLSELYNRLVRRRIWIDPNHQWEIGAGTVTRSDIEHRFLDAGFRLQKRQQLPYSDYWILSKPRRTAIA